MTEYQVKVIFN